jgi:hypothetical protein
MAGEIATAAKGYINGDALVTLGWISATQVTQCVTDAVARYGKAVPWVQCYQFTGDGTNVRAHNTMTGFVVGYSEIRTVEVPFDEIISHVLPDDEWESFLHPTRGWCLRFKDRAPSASEQVLVTFTVPWDDTGIVPAPCRSGVAKLAASLMCLTIAAYFAKGQDSTVSVDSFSGPTSSAEWRALARSLLDAYNAEVLGKGDAGASDVKAASSAIQLKGTWDLYGEPDELEDR